VKEQLETIEAPPVTVQIEEAEQDKADDLLCAHLQSEASTRVETAIAVSSNIDRYSLVSKSIKCEVIVDHTLHEGRLTEVLQPLQADLIIVRSGIEMVADPLVLFRQLWTALKPGGRCALCFSSSFSTPTGSRPVKMWTSMTDEQKLWLAGSYFHYSAREGWEQLEAYDLHGHTGRDALVFDSTEAQSATSTFVVQARKPVFPPLDARASHEALAESVRCRLLGLQHLRPTDAKYLSLRLAALLQSQADACQSAGDAEQMIAGSIPAIYRVLAGKYPVRVQGSSTKCCLTFFYAFLAEVSDGVVPPVMKSLLVALVLPQVRHAY
jgi:SAM-dependent methyltransferase